MLKDLSIRKPSNLHLAILKKERVLILRDKNNVISFPLKESFKFINSQLFAEKNLIEEKGFYSTYNVTLAQAILGLGVGYRKQLTIAGIGYSCEYKNDSHSLILKLGFSHTVIFPLDKQIIAACPKPRLIVLKSLDKKALHKCAQEIQNLRKPNPYKDLGIYHADVKYRTKVGKKT